MNWQAEALWEAIVPSLPGFSVEILPALPSTNTELMQRARAGRTEPTLLVAEQQTAGRGRLGRTWASDVGDSLTFSLGLPLAPADWAGLSLAVGVAVAEALDPRVSIKWPNDLWVDGRKLAGILVETAGFGGQAGGPRQAVIGIGINIAPRPADGLSTPPACLQALWPQADAPSALARIAWPLVQALQAFEREGFAAFQARYAARDALRDRAVTLSDGRSGTAHGVTESGALLVHTESGMQAVSSAEVSVRPLA